MTDDDRMTDLGQDLEDYVDELVKTGRYDSRDDVLREGVRLLEVREKRKAELDAALARGLADIEAGRGKPMEEVAARLKAKYAAMAKEPRQ
ncbi:type II toxin-antitoxin system ParD family antitoxin [Neorhizobium alkalisoli]|uniref:Antitoxin ParD1/3/4 n=1 Tax=Neorhizobium alkalisoli TaxID=528178 RepID=A0A561QWR1_9HYPH|nr:type II toxin-antitoxin system ParD family antitoxin [Neorhizobium alkalisoli]TWF54749.1 antitoxin ParD1/3/4 [Neorhizobium alkalisoli]